MGPRRVTAKFRAMIEAYKGQAALSVTEAARMAGYGDPSRVGWELKRRFPEVFAEAEAEFRERLKISSEELDELISNLARNPKHKDHYKALELLCRMTGRLSEKVHVTLDRSAMNAQLDEMLTLMMKSRAADKQMTIVDATAVPIQDVSTAQLPAVSQDSN